MLSDNYSTSSFGEIKGPEPDASILAVVAFVEKYLVVFSKKYTGSTIKNEKGLTQKLVLLLNLHSNAEMFHFEKEFMESPGRGDSPQVDIGTFGKREEGFVIGAKRYAYDESFFSMEAKRLDLLGKKRSKEYLIGRVEEEKYVSCGGVERFKQEIHGRNLKYGAIIAYVQKYDFDHWHQSINSWIDDLMQKNIYSPVPWSASDKLRQEHIGNYTARFTSRNARQSDSIILFHLWVNLISKK